MATNQPSEQVVLQRVRNRIIEYLDTAASFREQRRFRATVPIADAVNEVICQWEDFVDRDRLEEYGPPVFSHEEVEAMTDFQATWKGVADSLGPRSLSLEQAQALPEWVRLRDDAQAALKTFAVRGKLSEDRKIENDTGYPFFDEAVRKLQNFLESQERSRDVTWVTVDDVALRSGNIYVRPQPETGEAAAARAYRLGVRKRLGVLLAMLCPLDGQSCCYVWAPIDKDQSARHLMPDGLKLSTPQDPYPAYRVHSRLQWAWRRRRKDAGTEFLFG